LKRALFELGSFNRAVDVRSEDTYFASALVDARMIAWLSDNLDRCVIEVADGWAVAWSNSLLGAMRSPTELLDVLQRFAERIPNSVRSLFPRGDRPEMGWVHSRPRKGVSALIDRISEEPSGSPTTPGD
jgi:hypothetical protein